MLLRKTFTLLLSFAFSFTEMPYNRNQTYQHAFFTKTEKHRSYSPPELLVFSSTVTDFLECRFRCLSHENCWSVNYLEAAMENGATCQGFAWDSGIYKPHLDVKQGSFYSRIKTPCDNSPCLNGGTCQPSSQEPLFRCDCGPTSRYGGERCQIDCVVFDFEEGISGWQATGTAFKWQPTNGDNPTRRHRGQPSNHHGNWWIGTFENRSDPQFPSGSIQGDAPKGTLTSPQFTIYGSKLSFLIGGGCNVDVEFVELIVSGTPVAVATGRCNETMEEQSWNVTIFRKQTAWIRLVDNGSEGWHHINFDHLKDSFCEENVAEVN